MRRWPLHRRYNADGTGSPARSRRATDAAERATASPGLDSGRGHPSLTAPPAPQRRQHALARRVSARRRRRRPRDRQPQALQRGRACLAGRSTDTTAAAGHARSPIQSRARAAAVVASATAGPVPARGADIARRPARPARRRCRRAGSASSACPPPVWPSQSSAPAGPAPGLQSPSAHHDPPGVAVALLDRPARRARGRCGRAADRHRVGRTRREIAARPPRPARRCCVLGGVSTATVPQSPWRHGETLLVGPAAGLSVPRKSPARPAAGLRHPEGPRQAGRGPADTPGAPSKGRRQASQVRLRQTGRANPGSVQAWRPCRRGFRAQRSGPSSTRVAPARRSRPSPGSCADTARALSTAASGRSRP